MRATHRLIGCALCIVGLGSASAASLGTQELNGSVHVAADNAPTREGSAASGGDALELNHESAPDSTGNSGSSDSSSGSAASGGNEHAANTPSAPAPARPLHLGWQSLLPGSIQ
ncbi:MAG: hypothetical protein KGJ96_06995 [Xanthomonadaceae bacterium]|jgi:hypothetical protein|nr:hypothetical protein [Xanthomonadaceae bacterium]MDE2248305.1 hypothetical protein [Xanthomonadaceae bacterium]